MKQTIFCEPLQMKDLNDTKALSSWIHQLIHKAGELAEVEFTISTDIDYQCALINVEISMEES